jgi:hypothetical protein
VRRNPPSAAGLSLCALLAACGRLGFAPASYDIEPSHGRDAAVPVNGDGDDGDGDGDDGDPGRDASASAPDGGGPSLDGGSIPMDDAAAPLEDGGSEADAGDSLSPLYPLPRNIVCSDYTGLLACDDQAGETAGAAVTPAQENGTLALEQGYAAAVAPGESAYCVLESQFAAYTSGQMFLRFSLYIPASVAIAGLNIATIGSFDTGEDFGLDLNLTPNRLEIYVTGDGSQPGATYDPPRDQWLCVLFKVEAIDGANGHARVLIDDQEILDAPGIDTLPPGGVSAAAAGIDWTYDGQADTTLYVKNFLVTRDHPGSCP